MKRANLQMLIHRFSCVPWLLAASLVLGWAGAAPAQNLSGSFDRGVVYEGGGAQDITVTLKTEGDVAAKADIQVHMYLDPDSQTAKYRGDLFTVSTPTLLLKKGEKEVTGTLTITPVDNDRIGVTPAETATLTESLNLTKMVFAMSARSTNFTTADSLHLSPNIPILFAFASGTGSKVSFASKNLIKWPDADATDGFVYFPFIELIDDDHWPGAIDLSLDPSKLNNQADATSIEVTGALDGGSLRDTTLSTQLAVTGGTLNRDTHYTLSDLGKLTIPKGKRSGTTRFTLDPNDTTNGTLTIGSSSNMTVVVKKRTHTYNDSIVEVRLDINYDGTFEKDGWEIDYGTFAFVNTQEGAHQNERGVLVWSRWGVDLDGDGAVGSELINNGTVAGVVTSFYLSKSDIIPAGTVLVEKTLGIDFFEDGDLLDIYVVPKNKELTEIGLYEQDIGYGSGAFDYIGSKYGKESGKKFFQRGNIDFNGDGNFKGELSGTLKYVNSFAFPVKVNSGTITIEADPTAKSKSFTLSPETIRENAGATDVQMTVEFDKALTKATTVTFKLTPTAGSGTRDVDYVADVVGGTVTIPAGDTKGTGMLRVTPVDNDKVGSTLNQWTFEVEALSGTTSLGKKTFTISDDETLSENIVLSASPNEIKEDAGATTVTISAALDGKPLAADATITLVRDSTPDKSATRDIDYTAVLSVLTIPQGELTGSTTITITPINDGVAADDKDKDETITLKQLTDNIENQDNAKVVVESVAITLKEVASSDTTTTTTTPSTAAAMGPSFGADADSLAFAATVGQAFSAVLPEAMGDGTLMYSVSTALPAGLSFAPATRTISGTPTMAGLATVVYTALDSAGHGGARTFTITVSEARPVTVGVASVMASQSAVREDGETAEIQVTATLSGAATEDQRVRFTIVPPSSGTLASRDVDYTATLLGTVTIAAGGKTGSTTLFLSPIDNAAADGHKYLGIRASASGGWAQVDLRISDDETASTALVVSVMPSQLSESADLTEVQVMVALDGKPLAEAATVALSIDRASTATRDIDYLALFDPTITIAAGSIAGSTRLLLDPVADGMTEGDETIRIKAMLPGMAEGSATLVLTETAGEMMAGGGAMMSPLAFVEGASIAAQSYTAGTAIHALELPAAMGGEGAITYSVSDLPAGLSFDAATRMISGTPDAATDGAVEVTYTAMAGDESASLMFTITVNPMLDFGDLSSLFGGAGKRVPLQAGLNADARLYLDAPTALPSVGEEFVLDVRLADFVAVRGYGLQIAYDADKLAFVRALPQDREWAAPQVLAEAGVLTVVAHGATVSDGELGLRLVFRPTTEIASTTLEITDNQTYDRALGVNRLALPMPVALQTRPAVFSLADNYPNPFNPTTTLQYALPQAADVALTVYNVLGQPVRTLVAERQNAGRYVVEWDATNDQGHRLSAGLYFYRLQAGGDFREVKKMLLLK